MLSDGVGNGNSMQVNINFSELEEQFAAKAVLNKPPHESPHKCAAVSGPAASVLDMDRARNVGVLMRSLKMDISAIQAALHASISHRTGDQRRLEEFEIVGILAAFPSAAEAQQLQSLRYVSARSGVSCMGGNLHCIGIGLTQHVKCLELSACAESAILRCVSHSLHACRTGLGACPLLQNSNLSCA